MIEGAAVEALAETELDSSASDGGEALADELGEAELPPDGSGGAEELHPSGMAQNPSPGLYWPSAAPEAPAGVSATPSPSRSQPSGMAQNSSPSWAKSGPAVKEDQHGR